MLNLMFLLALIMPQLIETTNKFNESIALRNLQIAASTYCDKTDIPGLTVIKEIRRATTVIIADDAVQDARAVSFRGSSDIENWISNFEVRFTEPYEDKRIKVHRGLYNEYLEYKAEIMVYLAPNMVISGHSSGGALSMFFAYDIHKTQPTINVTAYTFGKPRIGNDRFAESSKDITHYRITHHDDIVPHVPEEVLGYRHAGSEIWFYDDTDNYKICDVSSGEDPDCSNSCAPLKCTSISDHLYYMTTNIGGPFC
jgi:predicted lipase